MYDCYTGMQVFQKPEKEDPMLPADDQENPHSPMTHYRHLYFKCNSIDTYQTMKLYNMIYCHKQMQVSL